jgi:Flp pilus assembly protein TadD/glutathione synthase/RimK-type ligase-like ATP-grasp enzyme
MVRPPVPNDAEAFFQEAKDLEASGRDEDARNAYFAVLDVDPHHFGALNNLGNLFARSGHTAAALATYREALMRHPDNPAAHVNLGVALLEGSNLTAARNAFEAALALDADCAEAHQGLNAVFVRLGDDANADRHRKLGFRDRSIDRVPYRGDGKPVADVLLLLSSAGGNVDLRHILDDHRYAVTKLFVDVSDTAMQLPEHDLVFNAIGDADRCAAALDAAAELTRRTSKHVLNKPASVLRTTRIENAYRLGALPGVVAPRIQLFSRGALDGDPAEVFAQAGFAFPFLLRAPGHHSGDHFVRIEDSGGVRAALSRLPGAEVLAIEFLDARKVDGKVRKYRAMIVGGQVYPLHLAITSTWMVHYFTADNAREATSRFEEAAFLEYMPEAIGPVATAALDAIGAALDLDYAGVDFGLDRNGNLLLFEANATMTIPPEPVAKMWEYRRSAVHRALDAVESMLTLATGV